MFVIIGVCFLYFFFFFSSRRRHTRSLRDWSSDVCSSDLERQGHVPEGLKAVRAEVGRGLDQRALRASQPSEDRKSTRLNSSHVEISYAVFCLKKKNIVVVYAIDTVEKCFTLCSSLVSVSA